MSLFKNIFDKFKKAVRKTNSEKITDIINLSTISSKMSEAIELWGKMYEDKPPWMHHPTDLDPTSVTTLGLPSFIASEKSRMATIEMKSEITEKKSENEDGEDDLNIFTGNTERAEFLNNAYQELLEHIRTQLEYGIAKGGLAIRPKIKYNEDENGNVTYTGFTFDFIQADEFFPIAFDSNGKMTEAAFLYCKTDKTTRFTRLEYHKLEKNTLTIENKAFRSENINTNNVNLNDLGTEISLKSVPEWANIQSSLPINNIDRLLFSYFKMPEANTIEPHSPLGVSGYSRAVKLIEEADKQYSRLLWEFEGGELAIDVDRTMLMEDTETEITIRPRLQQRLFRTVNSSQDDIYNVFSPTLRDVSLINGLNTLLMRIEDVTALSRGTLSDVAAEARTATELKILKQRSFSANVDIQKALQKALEDTVYIMDTYCTLYNAVPQGEYDISFEWDDSIIVDADTELQKRIQLMQNGLASKIELRMWYFGETEEQAKEALRKIDEEAVKNVMNEME